MTMRILFALGIGIAIAAAPSVALAKPKAAKGVQITQQDLRSCLGVDGSDPKAQIAVCTKIINSGKVPAASAATATRGAAIS
jgi:hypothetical protein